MDVSVRREQIIHNHEVDFLPVWHLHAMKAVELGQKSVWVLRDMLVVFLEDLAEKLVLRVVNCLDDVLVVPREVEEAAALPR